MYWKKEEHEKRYVTKLNTSPKRGQIYWIRPNPYRDYGEHVQRAGRPAIIVSNNTLNRGNWSYEVVFLTTSPKKEMPTNCTIRSAEKVSTALCDQVQTCSSEQLAEYVGECTPQEMEAVDRCIMISLALDLAVGKVDTEAAEEDEKSDSAAVKRLQEENEQLKAKLMVATAHLKLMQNAYNELLENTLMFDKT